MANSDNDGCGTIIFWMIAIVVVWGFIGKACSGKKQTEQATQQINTQQISQQIKAQRIRELLNNRKVVANRPQTHSGNSEPTYEYRYTREISFANDNNSSSSPYYNYEETDYCVDGEVVYEGDDDYYVIETRRGYTICERYSGRLSEGMKVRGELNRYNFRYIINKHNDNEIRIYIEEYALSEDDALEWMEKNGHLKN